MNQNEMAKTEFLSQNESLYTVLVVDDDLTVLELICEVISMIPDCRCLKAHSPKEAMRLLTEARVDVVITDVHMPGQTGLDMISDMLHMEYSPEIIMMTAYPSSEIATNAMDLGISSILSKPFQDVSVVEIELDKAFKRVARRREAIKNMQPSLAGQTKALHSKVQPKSAQLKPAPLPSPALKASQVQVRPEKQKETKAEPGDELVEIEIEFNDAPQGHAKPQVLPPLLSLQNSPPSPKSSDTAPIELEEAASISIPEGALRQHPLKIYDLEFAQNIIEIERSRCDRYKRQFSIFYVTFDQTSSNIQALTQVEKQRNHDATLDLFKKRLRASDVMAKCDENSFLFLAFECNKVGAYVVKQKLMSKVLFPVLIGTATYPTDGNDYSALFAAAESSQQTSKKLNILVYEEEEFFRNIMQNMLSDPKFHVTFVDKAEKAYEQICLTLDHLHLFLFGISRNSDENLKLLYKIKKENIGSKMKMLIMAETIPPKEAIESLKQLGVSGMIKKGSSQEEVLHIVHSLIVPKPYENVRRHKRALVTIPVKYSYEQHEYSTNTFTLARGGMFMKDLNPHPVGTILRVRFALPGYSSEFSCEAEVVYSIPYFVGVANMHTPGMAVKFNDLPEKEMQIIDEFVNRCYSNYFF